MATVGASFWGFFNKVWIRIEGWKGKLFSNGAWLILLKHVLQSIPIHCLAILPTPKTVIDKLKRLMSTFFWRVSEGKPKRKWLSWDDMCKPVLEGGVGLRRLQDVQTSLHMKLAWNLLQGNSLWARFFLAKYVGLAHISIVDPQKGTSF